MNHKTKNHEVKMVHASKKHNAKLFIIQNACPICNGDIKGNYEYGLYCRPCNVLYRPAHLGWSKAKFDRLEKAHEIKEKFNVPEDAVTSEGEIKKMEERQGEEKAEPEPAHARKPKLQQGKQYESQLVASKNSNKVHLKNCFFARNIKEENLISFRDLDDALDNDYELCVCLKEK